jgi:hypothetical protein
MEKLQKKYYNTKEEKKKAKHMLSNKANRQNLDKQIDNIKK